MQLRFLLIINCFRLLWDELLSGQRFDGPYSSALSMSECSILMLTMLFARLDDNEFLTAARCCNRTYYPCIPDESSEESMARFLESQSEFIAHCRLVLIIVTRIGSYFDFRSCRDCLERYSSLRCHHVRSDLAFALICSFLKRAVLTYKVLVDDSGSEYITFMDGVGCTAKDSKSLGTHVMFFPGRAERRYETTASDSPARYF